MRLLDPASSSSQELAGGCEKPLPQTCILLNPKPSAGRQLSDELGPHVPHDVGCLGLGFRALPCLRVVLLRLCTFDNHPEMFATCGGR